MDPTEQPPSTRSHLDGGGTEDNETIPTPTSPPPLPPLPAELLIAILEEFALDDRTSLEEKHQTLERGRIVSTAFDSVVRTARPLLFHEVKLDVDNLQSPSPLFIRLLQRDGASVKGLYFPDEPARTVDVIDPALLHILSTGISPFSLISFATMSPQITRVLVSSCFLHWAQLRSLQVPLWIVPTSSFQHFPHLKRLTASSIRYQLSEISAGAPPLALTHLGTGGGNMWPLASDDFHRFTAPSTSTPTTLSLYLLDNVFSPELSHLSSLRTFLINDETAPADFDVAHLGVLLKILNSCPPPVQYLTVIIPPRTCASDFLEDGGFLSHLPPSLRHLVLYLYPTLSFSYLNSHFSQPAYLPHLAYFEIALEEGADELEMLLGTKHPGLTIRGRLVEDEDKEEGWEE